MVEQVKDPVVNVRFATDTTPDMHTACTLHRLRLRVDDWARSRPEEIHTVFKSPCPVTAVVKGLRDLADEIEKRFAS